MSHIVNIIIIIIKIIISISISGFMVLWRPAWVFCDRHGYSATSSGYSANHVTECGYSATWSGYSAT